ncbi:MAG: UPF0149 family protein [Sulfuritalea sp.]|nr:UPF0149 family protein [Sulfuritalea sp.]
MNTDLNIPLSDAELDELDRFLLSDAINDEAMDISMLDGFLTALAIGPNLLPPSRWLPVIWGGPMTWESEAQAKRIMALVFRHANDILFYLRGHPDEFEPLLYESERQGKKVPIIDEWCTGFITGMALDEEAWQPLMESEEGSDMLYPIMLYGTEAGWERLRTDPALAGRHEEFAAALGDSVIAIMDWWLPLRKAQATLRRPEPKVGRNDPCPCGSGKKFKQCCGGLKTLH